jgi:hypothetical protein
MAWRGKRWLGEVWLGTGEARTGRAGKIFRRNYEIARPGRVVPGTVWWSDVWMAEARFGGAWRGRVRYGVVG